jgi:hypothetical protein
MAFLDKLLSLFGGNQDPEKGKKNRLKQLVKEISGSKYARFYKPKSEEADGSLGKWFYDIYKIVSPAQVFMANAAKSALLKQIAAEAFFDKNLLEINRRISAEFIEQQAKTAAVKDIVHQLKKDTAALTAAFDSERVGAIDRCYNLILAFIQFVSFDFFFTLKKFDGNISERNFTYQPKFTPVRGEYLTDDLKDFLEVSAGIDPDQDWKNALRVLKNYKNGMDVVPLEQWTRLLASLRDVRKSGILELMIRHISKDPLWVSRPSPQEEYIADAYLESRRAGAKEAVDKLVNAKRNAQIDVLVKTVFGAAETDRMKYYSEKGNEIYAKKGFDGFLFARGLNYLRAFLLDHFKKDIRELCDILLIRGQWTEAVLAQQMSGGFHKIMEMSDTLISFDESFSDNGENGARLKAAIVKADRDKSQARYVTLILKTGNEEAQGMMNTSAQALINIGKNLKNLIDDYQKNPHELIMNWRELEGASEVPIGQRMAETYKKIYYFVQMMQLLSKPGEE